MFLAFSQYWTLNGFTVQLAKLKHTYNMWVEYYKPNEKLVNPHIKTKAEKKIAFNPLFRGRLGVAS